jgi:hypothetical protein
MADPVGLFAGGRKKKQVLDPERAAQLERMADPRIITRGPEEAEVWDMMWDTLPGETSKEKAAFRSRTDDEFRAQFGALVDAGKFAEADSLAQELIAGGGRPDLAMAYTQELAKRNLMIHELRQVTPAGNPAPVPDPAGLVRQRRAELEAHQRAATPRRRK